MRKMLLCLGLVAAASLDACPAGVWAAPSDAGVSGAAIVQTALQYLGYPYTTVGNSPSTGFSCIGFVSYVYQVNGIPLPDDLGAAMAYASPVAFADLQPGDVLYFQNTVWTGLSHTAIYLGGGRFVHAEWYNRGVVISSFTGDPIDGDYWIAHYLGANRPWGGVSSVTPSPASTVVSPTSPPPAPRPVLRDGPRAQVQVAGVNVRVRPSLAAPVGGLATAGTAVVVLKQYGSWDWVQLSDGSFGWVIASALGAPGRAASSPLALLRISVSGLRVHVRPGLAAPVLGTAGAGQRVLVLRRWNGWVRVLLSDGTRGWVSGAYVGGGGAPAGSPAPRSTTSPASSSPRPATVSGARLDAAVRLRQRPGLSAPVLGLAAPGTRLRVLTSWLGWAYVRLPSGRGGWVDVAYIHF